VAEANGWLRDERLHSGPMELSFTLDHAEGLAGIRLYSGQDQATLVAIDRTKEQVLVDRTKSGQTGFHSTFAGVYAAPLLRKATPVALRLFVDTSSVEVFVNDGEQVLTCVIFPDADNTGLEFFGGETATISNAEVWKLARTED
jgi:fructan beta-fructosidase